MNGLHTEINEKDFMKMTIKQQNLLMFNAICYMSKNGCLWGQQKNKIRTKKMYIIGALSGGAGGVIVALGRVLGIDLSKLF